MKIAATFIFVLLMAAVRSDAQEHTVIKRDSFSLKYPSTWTIDTEDEDYDPDALFSIESPDGDNMIMFIIFNVAVDKDELMKAQIEAFSSELVKNPEISSFDKWGKYNGSGKMLTGKLLGVFKGYVRIFIYGDEHKTMLVVEQYYEKAYQKLKGDYDLISSSFSFK